jgi:small subunit ribosomal protein S20
MQSEQSLPRRQAYAIIQGRSHASVNVASSEAYFSEELQLANLKSAKKRMRQNEKRRAHNRRYQSAARTHIKRCRRLIAQGELDQAEEAVRQAVSTLDKAARKGVIHPNNAARRKSRIMTQLADAKREAGLL